MKKTTRNIVLCLCLFVLTGCVSTMLSSSLHKFVGMPKDAAVAALGAPNQVDTLPNGTEVYTWANHGIGTMALPQNRSYSGFVGGTPFSMTSTGLSVQNVSYSCTIRLTMKNGHIVAFDFYGDRGCEPYIDRLDNYLDHLSKRQ